MARTTGSGSDSGRNEVVSPADTAQVALGKLGQTACSELTSVTVRLGQKYSQAAADYRRAMMAVQIGAQTAQETAARDYMDAMQSSGTDASEVAQRCNRAIEEARKTAQLGAERSVEEARRTIDQGIVEANAGWDAACAGYIGALKNRIAEIDPVSPDPSDLAAAAKGLGWIAMRVKRKNIR